MREEEGEDSGRRPWTRFREYGSGRVRSKISFKIQVTQEMGRIYKFHFGILGLSFKAWTLERMVYRARRSLRVDGRREQIAQDVGFKVQLTVQRNWRLR